MVAKKPIEQDAIEERYAERSAALYDPDSVFRDHVAELQALRAVADAATIAEPQAAPLFARGERTRAVKSMTPEMIKRIADRAELAAKKRGGGS